MKKTIFAVVETKNKKRPVPKNLELARFSPIQLQKIENYKIRIILWNFHHPVNSLL